MATLPKDYPYGATDKAISTTIRELSNDVLGSGANINRVLQLTPLIALGQNELQSRQTRRITCLSIGLGALSLLVSAAALYVSLISSRTGASSED